MNSLYFSASVLWQVLYSLCESVGLRDASPAVQQLILTALKAVNDGSYLNLTGTSFQNAGWNWSYYSAQTTDLGLQGKPAVVVPLMHCLQASALSLKCGQSYPQEGADCQWIIAAQEQLTEQVQNLQDAVFSSLATSTQTALLGYELGSVREGQSATAEDALQQSKGVSHAVATDGSSPATEKAVPGIIAVVHPEFFTRASAVAVQLLKVHTNASIRQSLLHLLASSS